MIYYCCANNINIGDHFSMLGVKDAVRLSGRDMFLERRKVPLAKELDGLSSSDVLIIGGGGIIKDYFRKYWLDILKYKKKKNYKIYIFGIGVCDHKHVSKSTVFEEKIIKEIINNSKISYLRPPVPIKDHRIKETFCPSMLYVYNKYKNKNIPIRNQLLYVSHDGLVGKNINLNIINLLKEYCKDKGLSYSQVSNIARKQNDVENIMGKYLSSKIIVTSRLHGYIIGRSLGKKVIAISKDYKIEGFASIIGDKKPIDAKDINRNLLFKSIDNSKAISDEKLTKSIKDIMAKGAKIKRSIIT